MLTLVTKELVDLRRIEAQMRAIEKWDGRLFKPPPERP